MNESPLKALMDVMPQTGRVEFISVRPARKELPKPVEIVNANPKSGLEGDHFSSSFSKKRQVTLIQEEHLQAVGNILKIKIDPLLTRRNIVVSGINLLALKDRSFAIGSAIFKGTGYCHPCSRMEKNLGPGGYNAMRGHGGLTAEVLQEGVIELGSEVRLIP